MLKVWWFQIETSQRRYQSAQGLPEGVPLRPLAGVDIP